MSKLLWTQKQDIGPSPRFNHAMVFDAARGRVLLFGGDGAGQSFRDTWEWDGADWTQIEDIGPSPRAGHAMAYDSARSRTVLFGGNSVGVDMNDTWEWDGESWTQIQDAGPKPRQFHAMTFDTARQRVVLFGGAALGAAPFGDTWEWDGEDWSQTDDVGPAARMGHAMSYDSVRQRVVLFGGAGAAPNALSDTWERDSGSWRQVQDIGPPGAIRAALVFRTSVSALFGGSSSQDPNANPQLFGVTWEWDGSHWTARQDIGVSPRFGHAMAFDSARKRVVLFGGLGLPDQGAQGAGALKGDTWEHADIAPSGAAGPRLQSLSAAPNPVFAGQALGITVQLQAPVLTTTPVVIVFSGLLAGVPGMPRTAAVEVPAMTTTGGVQVQLPLNIPLQLPVPLTITAHTDQGQEVGTIVIVS